MSSEQWWFLLSLAPDGSATRRCDFRRAELDKEVAMLKEKIHHLDDMLKSQQRKVRHMIEQVHTHTHTHTHTETDMSYLHVVVCSVQNAAAELPDHHAREGSSHQRSRRKGGFPGGGG